jgi:hypothetical protein
MLRMSFGGLGDTMPWADWCATQDTSNNFFCAALLAAGCQSASDCGLDPGCLANAAACQDSAAGSALTQCQAKADLETSPLDTLAQSLASNWNPTGYYTPDVIQQVVSKQQEMSQAARAAITAVQSAPGDNSSLIKDRLDGLASADAQGTNYLAAAATAAATNSAVSAPNLKDWAINSLRAASDAHHAAVVISCVATDYGLVAQFGQFLYSVAGVAADVLQTAYNAGKNIVQAVETGFGVLAWMTANVPLVIGFGVLLLGGAIAWKNRDRFRRKPALAGHRRK